MESSTQTSVNVVPIKRARGQRRAPSRAVRPRSAVTSGRQLFHDGNSKSAWSRRFHDLILGHIADLGGADLLSEAQFSLIRRAAAIETELERLDARLSRDEAVDMDAYARVAGHLRRLFETLGLKRVPRNINADLNMLDRYLARPTEGAGA
jgi:hypothetical protein